MDKNYILDRRAYMERRQNPLRRDASRFDSADSERRDRRERRSLEDEPNTLVFEDEDDLHAYIQTIPDLEKKDFMATIDDNGRLYKIIEKS